MNSGPTPANMPMLSVVIPTYNRADYIAETIASVLQQSYENVEIIVVDDGSTDNTREVVERFAPRVRYVWQENAERGASRNHGLRLAKGDYVAFLDSDDLWLPTKAATGVEFLEANPGVGLIYTDSVQIDGEGRELRLLRSSGPSRRVTASLLENNFVGIATQIARTALVREIGGFREEREISGSEDWELWVRLSLVTDFAYVSGVTAKVRTHLANTMSDPAAMRRSMARAAELFRGCGQLAPYRKSLRRMDAYIALMNAINACSGNDRRASIAFLRNAVAASPAILLDPRFGYTIFRLLKSYAAA